MPHSPAIEGNLEGESPDRAVLVVLPPSYRSSPRRRYPVVYALHGYSIGAEQWIGEIHVPQTIEGAFAKGAREMILVLPDSKTAHNGSFYSSSVTVGDFETFVARDLVAYVDGHYRTLADRRSRGLALAARRERHDHHQHPARRENYPAHFTLRSVSPGAPGPSSRGFNPSAKRRSKQACSKESLADTRDISASKREPLAVVSSMARANPCW